MQASRGYPDYSLKVCEAQNIPTDGSADVSGNAIDLKTTTPGFVGAGSAITVVLTVTTALDTATTTTKLTIEVITDDNDSFSSATVIAPVGDIDIPTTAIAAGENYVWGLPTKTQDSYERYLGIQMNPASNDLSAGAVNAWILPR